jgi:glutamine synthetase
MERAEILKQAEKEDVRFLRLQFTDILGQVKHVEVRRNQFEKALDGQVLFDGSSIEGFVRIEESDMLLVSDLKTFRVFPWTSENGKVARLLCDIHHPDGRPFDGCPRLALKRVCEQARKGGYTMMAGPEAEFFLFHRDEHGNPTTRTHDAGGYFDLTPIDRGEECRRRIVEVLELMGFEVEAAHHEVAQGQHEIDFKYADAVTTADHIATFRHIVRKVALDFDLHATFMPKPLYGQNGSGMHTHQSLFKGEHNVFHDPQKKYELSDTCLWYIGGVLAHARGFCAITNPLINSYKRLVPGYEAPTNVAWSERNRSPLLRVPDRRGIGTRAELRMPDPSCNPYLALAVMLGSGLDGIAKRIDPGEPVNKNIYKMSHRERRRLKIENLPVNLNEAVGMLRKDSVVQAVLGEHIYSHYLTAKHEEWSDYIAHIHPWEVDRYLAAY